MNIKLEVCLFDFSWTPEEVELRLFNICLPPQSDKVPTYRERAFFDFYYCREKQNLDYLEFLFIRWVQ